MLLKLLLVFLSATWKFGLPVPVHFKDFLISPSCTFWDKTHEDKSFFYLIGTAAHIEVNVIRLRAYFEKTLFEGTEASVQKDEDRDDGETLEKDGSEDVDALVENMKILRKTLNEYYLPRLDEIIAIETRMLLYNSNPFMNEFSLLKVKVHDLDCLLRYWIKQREPKYQSDADTYAALQGGYEIQYINSEEMRLLDKMAERLDWFLSSKALVAVVRSLMNINKDPTDEEPIESQIRQLRSKLNY